MKKLLVIAMTLASVSAFAEHHDNHAHKAVMDACAKEFKGDKAKTEACVVEKTKAAAATATTTTEAAPATAPAPAAKK